MATVEEKAGPGGRGVSEEVLRRFFREMLLIRRFEEKVEERFRAGELPGFLHVAIGEEATATGVCAALERDDVIASTHRAHGHAIAKGTPIERIMAELYGKVEGCSHGYGGSMHLYDVEVGNLGANAVVAGGIPGIVGAALAFQWRNEPRVAVAFFGDGATNTGTFHESLNLGQLWKVPAIFVLENNGWAESTPAKQHLPLPVDELGKRAQAYGMKLIEADGQDVEAVYLAALAAREHAVSGKGPVLAPSAHVPAHRPLRRRRADLPRQARAPRNARDEGPDRAPARAPRAHRRRVRGDRLRDHGRGRGIRRVREGGHGPEARRRAQVRLCLRSRTGRRCATLSRGRCARTTASSSWARTSPRWAAPWRVTQGLLEEFGPKRVRNTPISEMAIVGSGIGAAMQGLRPIVEIMYEDFLTLSMEQLVNQAAKHRTMSGGQLKVPLTIRTQGGAGWSPGAQHAQQVEAWFVHVPGLKVVFASTPEDVRGLLWSSIYDENPVVFFEHRTLYPIKGEVPEELEPIPLGKARVHREGTDVTVVATGRLVHESLAAAEEAEKDGISVEVVDPRTLQPLDEETIIASVRKTTRAVTAHEAVTRGGFGAELTAVIQHGAFDYLDAPIERVGAKFAPLPFAPVMEEHVVPHAADVLDAIRRTVARA